MTTGYRQREPVFERDALDRTTDVVGAEDVYPIDNVDLSRISFFPGDRGGQRYRGNGRRR